MQKQNLIPRNYQFAEDIDINYFSERKDARSIS
jgi:hypothetical protein